MSGSEEFSVSEAARRLGISQDAVRSRIKRGTLIARRRRGQVFVILEPSSPQPPSAPENATNPATIPEVDEVRREIEHFSLHVSQVKRERDRLIRQVEHQQQLLQQEQTLRKQSQAQIESLVTLLAAALPEVSSDPQEGANKLWRRLEEQLKRVNETGEATSGKALPSGTAGPSEVHRAEPTRSKATIPKEFLGSWRIREISGHSRSEIESAGGALISFDNGGGGSLRFLGVEAEIDCRGSTQGGSTFVDFTWTGFRNGSPISGLGWARMPEGGSLTGYLWAHGEGDANFAAVKDRPTTSM